MERGGGKDKVYIGAKCVTGGSGREGTLSMSCINTYIDVQSIPRDKVNNTWSKLTDCVRLTLRDSLLG